MENNPDQVSIDEFCDAAKAGDVAMLRQMLRSRPELVNMDLAENDEHRAIHFAVLHRHAEAVRMLMEAGSDARKGVYPNRAATTALVIAQDRGYGEIVDAIEQGEQARREAASCPNATVTPAQDQITAAIRAGKNDEAIALLVADPGLIKACDRDGASPLHIAAEALNEKMVEWLLEPGRRFGVQKEDLAGRMPLDRAAGAVGPRNKDSIQRFAAVADRLRQAGAPLTARSAIALGEGEGGDRLAEFFRDDPRQFTPGSAFIKPLTIAVCHRRHDMLKVLLDLGLDPNEREQLSNVEGQVYTSGNPLWHAVLGDDWESAIILLDRGADPNANVYASGSPTSQAFGTRNARMQKLMLERGGQLSPDFLGLYRQTDRVRGWFDGSEPISPNARGYPGPTVAEQLLWGGACGGDPEIVRLALQRIDWPATDTRWFNMAVQPLRIWNHGPGFWAGGYDRSSTYAECFRQIISRMDVNMIGRHGQSLLHRVASDGWTWGQPVMTSAERLAFATVLLNAGARFDGRDEILASTPLAWAALGLHELVELYLSRGIPANEPDAEPWATPLAWATRYSHDHIAAMLRAAGG